MAMFPRTEAIKPIKVDAARKCNRCGGSGIYSTWHGTCYRCGGRGIDPTPAKVWAFPSEWTEAECEAFLAAKAEARDKAANARLAKAEAAESARKGAAMVDPDMAPIIAAEAAGVWVSPTASDIIARHITKGYSITEGQRRVLAAEAARIPARTAKAEAEAEARKVASPVPTGKVEIVGEVVTTKVVYGDYGSTLKMMLKGDAGWRVWVTVPSALDVSTGDRVRLTATVTASNDDPTFGFGSRPSKAAVLA